jgi:hypothetical protein
MRSPFHLTSTFSLNQSDFHITSESYLLNHVVQALDHRNMDFERLDENTLFYRQPLLRSMNRNDVLRTMEITVNTDFHYISFRLRTDFIKEILFSLFLLLTIYLGVISFPLVIKLIFPVIPLLTGLLLKKLKLWRIKKDIISYFNNLKH